MNETPPPRAELLRLVAIVERLRKECPWDSAQTLLSMRPYLLEETYEVLDAIGTPGTTDRAKVTEELGDLLFVVLLLTEIHRADSGDDAETVARRIAEKMITRHPHVFGDQAPAATDTTSNAAPSEALRSWESRKAGEAADGGARKERLGGVPRTLPALLRAHRQAEKASAVGFDWADRQGVLDKIDEERAELVEALASGDPRAIEHEYGDLLMATANLGRFIAAPAEDALQAANDRFRRRFGAMEEQARTEGAPLDGRTPADLDRLWERAKEDG